MAKRIAEIPLASVAGIELYINKCLHTMAKVRELAAKRRPDCDLYLLNGGMWNADMSPCPLLKAEGVMLSKTPWGAYGYGWDAGADIKIRDDYSSVRNFVSCTCLIGPWGPVEKPGYDPVGQGGTRGRSAIGLRGDKLCLYMTSDGSRDARTPEALRDELAALGWDSAVMLDGGGSSQCDFNGDRLTSSRKVHNIIIVYVRRGEQDGKPAAGRTVCLDPGHGPGCVNGAPDGSYKEYEFAWDMSRRLRAHLERCGVNVIMTKEETGYPSLNERIRISNAAAVDLFVSLHSNAQGGTGWGTARGLMIYTSQGPLTAARNVAAMDILDAMKEAGVALHGSGLAHNIEYAVLRGTTAPAVLIEYGFHTNREDVALLRDGAYRAKLAEATARGVCNFLGVEWAPETSEAPAPWYEEDRAWAMALGITDGARPEEASTRAEEWAMLHRLYEAVKAGK